MWHKQRTTQRTRREQKIFDVLTSMPPEELQKIGTPIDLTDTTGTKYLNNTGTPIGGGWSYVQRTELQMDPESFVYCSNIIANHAHFYDDSDHREQVHEFNALLAAACKKIPKAVWAISPLFFHPDKEAKTKDDLEPFSECEEAFKKHQWLKLLKVATKKSIKHNWFVYEPLDIFKIPWYTKPPWKCYAADEITQIDEWKYGHPTKIRIHPSNDKYSAGYTIDVTKKFNEANEGFSLQLGGDKNKADYISGGIIFDPLDTDDFDAIPWYLGAWNAIQDYEAMCESQNSFKQTISTGFMVIGIPLDQYNDLKGLAEEKIKRARRGRGLVVPTSVDQPMELNWMAIPDADFTVDKEDIRKDIIAVIGFPQRWLYGNDEGALAGAETDRSAVYDEMKYIFYMMVPFIKQLLKYHGIIEELEDVEIHPPFEMQLTEGEKADIDAVKANTVLALSQVLTLDEMRKYMGYKELTDEQKAELDEMNGGGNEDESDDLDLRKQELREKDFDFRKERYESKSMKDAVERFYEWDRLVNETSIMDMVSITGRAKDTVGNMRNHINNMSIDLTDSLPLTDSINLGNGIYQIEGLVMPTQIKEYKEHNMTLERSLEEISKFMNNPLSRKEFPLGATNNDLHPEGVEVLMEDTIGKVELTDMSELGAMGRITIDLNKTREVLGPNSWVETFLKTNKRIPTSVALRATPIKISDNKHYEVKLDVRSFVATRLPRNPIAGGS